MVEMVEQNMDLVHYICWKHFKHLHATFGREDLISIGKVGLVKAVTKFKPELGYKFATYAYPLIYNEIQKFILNQNAGGIKFSRDKKREGFRVPCYSYQAMLDEEGGVVFEDGLGAEQDFSGAAVSEFMSLLDGRGRLICRLKMQGYSQAEIGKKVGLCQAQVSRIIIGIRGKWQQYQGVQ